ncbi:MAG: hypothetical protein B6242_10355 [Anaerolineaceae bacterium 4572_78]|nr:MAG: hypothetical protein B6242_10355 [Anaerolineaceae bacterium 4572_78]
MLKEVLNQPQENLLKEERKWLSDLQVIFAKIGATEEDHTTLKQSIQQLDELFLLVVVGEFNSGKSSFINALLGSAILKEGVTPTTAQVNILKYGETSTHNVMTPHLHTITEPIEILRHVSIVDTPGTNAIIKEHQRITEEFVPRSDIVLFITSADRPFTESERQFMTQIRDWGKKVVIIVNKIDIFEDSHEQQQVVDFVSENTKSLIGIRAEVFAISARKARRAKQGNPRLWTESQFEPLEEFIQNTLDEKSRIRLKFLNPLGVGSRLLNQYLEHVNYHLGLLKDDFELLDNLERQLKIYRQDMQRDFKFRLSDIEKVLFEMEKRGNDFFDDVMRIGRVADLLRSEHIKREFENEVVADAPQEIEMKIAELIDWLVNADLNQWQSVIGHLEERKKEHQKQIIGEVGKSFRYDREHLLDTVARSAQRVVDTYDKNIESRQIAASAQLSVMGSAAVSLAGIGTMVTALRFTHRRSSFHFGSICHPCS